MLFQINEVPDFLYRSIQNEHTSEKHDHAVDVKGAGHEAIFWKCKNRILDILDHGHDRKQQHDAQDHRKTNTQIAGKGLAFLGNALRFQRDVQQVVEAEDCLQQNQHE